MKASEVRQKLMEQGVPEDTVDQFLDYCRKYPDIWRHFERFALAAIAAGRQIGAKAIMERIRWEVEIEQKGTFKICNSYTAYYARLFRIKYPAQSEMFETRKITGLRRAA